jgi:NADP-dependent 3-hydroxy acid dehydrogenase YdfG
MKSLKGKRIIITGGSLGIGLAIAKKCANEGAEVIIAARNESDLKNALNTIKNISNKNHLTYSLNVGDLNCVNKFAQWVNNKDLEIHGVVNCAGIYGPIGKTHKVDMNDFSEAIQVNLLGTVYMCNVFSPMLVASIHKKTVNAGSDVVGSGFYKNTKKQIEDGGVPPEKAAELCSFLLSEASDGISGKFISAPWDAWEEKTFQDKLRQDKDFATLRRIDEKYFKKVE